MRFIRKIPLTISFLLFYLYKLVWSNLNLAYAILSPSFKMRPAIIAFPVEVKSDHEILSLVNFITMTPGTISLDMSDDKSKLYIHAMFVGDENEFTQEIRDLEKRIHKLYS